MSNWHLGPLALLDFESTGVDAFRDRIVTATVIAVIPADDPAARPAMQVHEWLIHPQITIPEGATNVHGITTEHAHTNGVDPAGAVHEIATSLLDLVSIGAPIVGHNVGGYDLTMLWAELTRHGNDPLAEQIRTVRPVVDTMVIEKHLDAFRPGKPNGKRPDHHCGSHRLIDACRIWGVPLSEEDAHGATADALAAGRLAWAMCQNPHRFAQYDSRPQDRINPADWPLDRLHEWQVETKAAQAEGLAKWLVKQGKPDDVSREFPVGTPPLDWTPEQLPVAPELEVAS